MPLHNLEPDAERRVAEAHAAPGVGAAQRGQARGLEAVARKDDARGGAAAQ